VQILESEFLGIRVEENTSDDVWSVFNKAVFALFSDVLKNKDNPDEYAVVEKFFALVKELKE
jgi:hypothetical protein